MKYLPIDLFSDCSELVELRNCASGNCLYVAFNMIEGKRKALQQVVYTLGNVVGLGLAVYKCQVMGLLPTHPSDWLAFVEPQKVDGCFTRHLFTVSHYTGDIQ